MTAPVVERRETRDPSQWQPLDGLAPYELREKLGNDVGAWSIDSGFCSFSFNNARLSVPTGSKGVPTMEMKGLDGTLSYKIPHTVIGQCGKLVLIVPPVTTRVGQYGGRETDLSWFEIHGGRVRRGTEILERLTEEQRQKPILAAVLQAAEEAEKQASRAHQALYDL